MRYAPLLSYKNKGERRGGRVPLAVKIILVIVVVWAILTFFLPQVLPTVFTFIVRPLWNLQMIDKENEELKRKLSANENLYAQTDVLIKENEELKSLFSRTASTTSTKILAQILRKPPLSAYDVFIIDIGKDKNLQKGQRVYALGNILIGEIAEINGNTSKVKLYSTKGEKFDVFIGKDSIQATAIGKGGGTFEVSLPRDTNIVKGDVVMVPSLTDAFVGRVEEIVSEASQPFSTLLFRQPFNMYELRWVLVESK